MIDRPSLILPVEVQSRELDAKLLLACLAAERGFRVFLGCRWRLLGQLHRLPPSVYFGKDVTERTGRVYDLLPRLGHAAMAWDEEALVYMTPAIYRRLKVSAASLAAPKMLFAWGEDNAEIWRATEGYAGQPILATGNPRADLMRPELRRYYADAVADIRSRFGSFVLVNSNFGWVNHYKPGVTEERLRVIGQDARDLPPEQVGTWSDPAMLTYRHDMFRAFLDMLPKLADRFPDRRFVLRPHPSENQETWRQAVAGRGNIQVVHEGGVTPWLLAAEAVIQNGCTTGVEAFLLGRPVIAYRPMRHPVYDMPLPNALGMAADDPEQLADAVAAAFKGELDALRGEERERLARRFVAAMDGPLAGERILDAVARSGSDLFERRPLFERATARLDGAVRAAKRALRLSGSHRSGHDVYVRHIFPDLPVERLRERIARLQRASERFGDIAVAVRGANLFELRAA